MAQPPRGDWRRIKPTAGLRFDPSRAGQATLVDSMVTARRVHKEPKKQEKKTGPSIETDARRVWEMDGQERFEWLENALLCVGRREMEFSKLDEVIGGPKFTSGVSNKYRGKMKEMLLANLHVFKKDQQKALKVVAESLGTPSSGSGGDENGDERRKRKKERRDSRDRSRGRRRDGSGDDRKEKKSKKQKTREEVDDSPGRGRQREPSEEDTRRRQREPSEEDKRKRSREYVWDDDVHDKEKKSSKGEKSDYLKEWEDKMLQSAREM
eukprot:gnl/MRDRNA2_/MRDRNA2_114277_c0_seq1.p1 gnl/MRDRNA2_/MRDRNA2_114277_c0~~gnl/MRDRNA2_/MRDRNA2_114277_c0_seq1.p1  ORF type:complete len:267 (+),score=66.12 gnl/MRDRNA2_/MRDRNA2_114277_c0_seq1:178-978(+)